MRIDKTKQQENMQELIKKESNEVEDKEEKYPIYDYLKEHPSIFISLISGFVVVIGFMFHCIMYINECKYLEYWNLNIGIINIKNEHQIYELVMISLLFFCLMFSQLFIVGSVNRYYKDEKEFWKARVLGKKINRKYRKIKKQIKKDKKGIKENNTGLLDKEIRKEEFYAEELRINLKGYKSSLKDVRKALGKVRIPYNIGAILFSFIYIFICFYIFIAMTSIESNNMNIVAVTIAIFCIGWIEAYLLLPIGYISEVYLEYGKLDYEEQMKQHIESFNRLLDVETFPIQDVFNINFKVFFEKDMLKRILVVFLVLMVVFIGMISHNNNKQIEQNKEFDIIAYENTHYAIMYRDDKYFYLEEVKIEENDIYIYVNNQLRISTDELYSVNREFDNVIKVPNEEMQ